MLEFLRLPKLIIINFDKCRINDQSKKIYALAPYEFAILLLQCRLFFPCQTMVKSGKHESNHPKPLRFDRKRNAERRLICSVDLIWNRMLSSYSSWIETTSDFNYFQQTVPFNPKLRRDSHEKGLPEDADAKASRGPYALWRHAINRSILWLKVFKLSQLKMNEMKGGKLWEYYLLQPYAFL